MNIKKMITALQLLSARSASPLITFADLEQILIAGQEEPTSKFKAPTWEEVKAYCEERKNSVDWKRWFNFYSANGWMVGRNKMKNWKAAVRTWEQETPTTSAHQNEEGRL